MNVKNMVSAKGNFIPNQFIIKEGDTVWFQSYDTIVARVSGSDVTLDIDALDYSRTTSKYLYLFLAEYAPKYKGCKKAELKKAKNITYEDLN